MPEAPPPEEPTPDTRPDVGLTTILREWGRIGCIGFGGPPTHIAMLRSLVVRREQWIDEAEFEDAIAATNLLPGPGLDPARHLLRLAPARRAGRPGRWGCLHLPRAGRSSSCSPPSSWPRTRRRGSRARRSEREPRWRPVALDAALG